MIYALRRAYVALKSERTTVAAFAFGIIFGLLLECVPILAIAYAQGGAGWNERWGRVLGGAKKEGSVVVWGPRGDLIRSAITLGFKKAFPDVDIEYVAGGGSELAAKARAERAGGLHSVDIMPSYRIIKPRVRYWRGYLEKNVPRSEEEENILKELFSK